ncbi:MAG: NRDE family protein, partial [Bacteroidetes bacterium]|nr:NRDE family protein [Bacteroidota bacterium]
MCTVTFIPVNNKLFITSNRDEQAKRLSAIKPEIYAMQTGNILFPKDAKAGGTWFALHENGNAAVFLNGGKIKHIPQPPYSKSRGLTLIDIIDSYEPFEKFLEISLDNIEPFTAIIWSNGKLYECAWDGSAKSFCRLRADLPHIWSSVTLYDDDAIMKRRKWFADWQRKYPQPELQDILTFHQFNDGDNHDGFLMNRNGITMTVSITSVEFDSGG